MPKQEQKNVLSEFELHKIYKQRLADPHINKALFGLIAWFEDAQIRDRKGEFSSLYHSSESRHAARSNITYWPSLINRQGYKIPMFLKVRNLEGEWASQIHAFPNLLGSRGKTPISVQDSNVFISSFCALNLTLLDESKLAKKQRLLEPMLQSTLKTIHSFKRGNTWNFWPMQEAVKGNISRSGPFNIWIEIAEPVLRRINTRIGRGVVSFLRKRAGLKLPNLEWLNQVLTHPDNLQGADAIFNIPNDADGTSLAIALSYLHAHQLSSELEHAIEEVVHFRDKNRKHTQAGTMRSQFEHWLPENSGAYLTWLKQESGQLFKQAHQGLIPNGINNVDIVVNANVLFMLSLTGKTRSKGYNACIDLLCKAVEQKAWPGAGLYYPQFLMFPYAFSRAIRDGGAQHAKLEQASRKLLLDVLAEAKSRRGLYYFEGGQDKSRHLSTALGLCTLLNLGEHTARSVNALEHYQQVVEGCMAYLLKQVRYKAFMFETTREKFNQTPWAQFIAHWEDGLFFGPVHWDLCHWRSQAITHTVILECLCKYLCNYDKNIHAKINHSCKLVIRAYTKEALLEQSWLSVEILRF